ncbi:MAG: Ig-like domain-containing protein [Proteobacteria bacterium]|jgi:polyhydroxybutyrate depolymerase|nr:Ig-like domain-containing protein [Pseudomonadota bacterium]
MKNLTKITAIGGLFVLVGCGGGGGAGTPSPPAPSALSYPSPQTFTVGRTIMPIGPAVTGSVANYSVTPTLPGGLTLDATSGQIMGTPSIAIPQQVHNITARNAAGSTSFALAIAVVPATQVTLEPFRATTIGVGQSINVYCVRQDGGAQFPDYVDPALVTWSSANPALVTVAANGVVTASRAGATTITAQYQSFVLELEVRVSGMFTSRSLSVPGQGLRRYSVYEPALGDASPRPLMVSMHGGGGSAQLQAAMTQMVELAAEHQMLVAFAEGTGAIATFNGGACCGTAQSQNIDDVSYVRAVIDDMQGRHNVDTARIIASGFSNGGIMAYRLACALSDRITGAFAVGGASGQFDRLGTQYYSCISARPIPVLHIHATNDRNYPYEGGRGDGLSATEYYSVDATVADSIARNNITAQSTTEQVSATTSCRTYERPADLSRPSARVALCRVDPQDNYDSVRGVVFGGGHSWPGGVRSPSPNSDVPSADFDANAYLWGFFNR